MARSRTRNHRVEMGEIVGEGIVVEDEARIVDFDDFDGYGERAFQESDDVV